VSGLRRAFLAVVPPPAVIRWTESAVDSVRTDGDGLRWSRTDQRHLTVKFFGSVSEVVRLTESVAESLLRSGRFTLTLGGGGAFPNGRRASVLWLGVREGGDAFADLAAPFADDDRPFRAHLTLARVAKARDLRAVVTALDACGESEPWTVDEVVLFDSETRADGAVHTEVARFRLAG
jgi:RNA 2',3'-cyclic 3'-phosphodiesterase